MSEKKKRPVPNGGVAYQNGHPQCPKCLVILTPNRVPNGKLRCPKCANLYHE